MKLRIIAGMSIALNVALALLCWKTSHPTPEREPAARPMAPTPDARVTAPTPPATPPATLASNSPPRFDWRTVESEDYRKYIANLRAIGCPEETIQDVIIADVGKLFAAQARAVAGAAARFDYWKTGNPIGAGLDEEKLARLEEIARHKRETLKTLLGIDVPASGDLLAGLGSYETADDVFSADTRAQLAELDQKYAARFLMATNPGPDGALRQLSAEKDQELLRLLGPDKKREYDLRFSESAVLIRMQLEGLDLSEPEFRDLFAARKKFDD